MADLLFGVAMALAVPAIAWLTTYALFFGLQASQLSSGSARVIDVLDREIRKN